MGPNPKAGILIRKAETHMEREAEIGVTHL